MAARRAACGDQRQLAPRHRGAARASGGAGLPRPLLGDGQALRLPLCRVPNPASPGAEYYAWSRRPLDLAAIRRAARTLVGEHDFASFASNPGYPRRRGTVRRIDAIRTVRRPHGFDLVVQGNGFLYNMVRTIAGTLRDVGSGKLTPEQVVDILDARDRSVAGMTMEAGGLFLLRVLYPKEALRHPR